MHTAAIYAASWLINPDMPPVAGGAVFVRDGIIAATGTMSELRKSYSAPVTEYPGCAILPGFVNAHTHLELTHFPSWRLRTNIDYNPRRFTDWIIQLIKISRGLTPADYPSSIQEGIRMCLESGTTAIGEIVSNPALSHIYQQSPLAGRLFYEVLGQEPSRFADKFNGAVAAANMPDTGGAMKAGLSPHTPYTVSEDHMPQIREAASSGKLPLAIHLSESASETDFIFNSSGPLAEEFYPFAGWERYLTAPRRCSSTELLDRNGLLTPSTLAVHSVHVSLSDARILKERGVSIVLCPRSNMRLDVGQAPLSLFKKLGIPLALGTDSLASNDSLSMWDEMRFALDNFARDLSPAEALRMATSGGAAALGIASSHGSLDVGKRADFQLIGNIGNGGNALQERIIREGSVQEIYTSGSRYTGGI